MVDSEHMRSRPNPVLVDWPRQGYRSHPASIHAEGSRPFRAFHFGRAAWQTAFRRSCDTVPSSLQFHAQTGRSWKSPADVEVSVRAERFSQSGS